MGSNSSKKDKSADVTSQKKKETKTETPVISDTLDGTSYPQTSILARDTNDDKANARKKNDKSADVTSRKKKETKTETPVISETLDGTSYPHTSILARDTNDDKAYARKPIPRNVYKNTSTVTPTDNRSNKSKTCDVIAAIEIGPTYSGCTFTFGKRYATEGSGLFNPYWQDTGSGILKQKTLTTILFDYNKTPHSIGYEAEHFYNIEKVEKDKWYLFKHFMKDIYKSKFFLDLEISDDYNKNNSMKLVDVMSEYFRFVKAKIQGTILEQTQIYTDKDVHWFLPVPAHWTDKHCLLLQNALEKTGVPKACQTYVKEPEATILYYQTVSRAPCLYDENNEIPPINEKHRCIVLDFQGSVLKLNVVEVLETRKVNILKSFVEEIPDKSQEFFRFLVKLFGGDVITRIREAHPSQYNELIQGFESKFKSFRPTKVQRVLIRVPPVWFETYRDITDEDLSNVVDNLPIANDFNIVMDKIAVSSELFQSFCDSSLKNSITIIEPILAKESASGIGIFYISGESADEVLVETLKNRFPNHRIISSKNPGLVNIKGSILYGIHREN